MKYIIATLLLSLVNAVSVWGTDVVSTKSGDWQEKSVWSGLGKKDNYPNGDSFDVTVKNGHTITIDGANFENGKVTIASLIVEVGAKLIIKGEVTFVLYAKDQGHDKAKATINGTVIFDGEYGGVIKAEAKNENGNNVTPTISLGSTAVVSGTGDIEAKVVNVDPNADISGYKPKNGPSKIYIKGSGTVGDRAVSSIAYTDARATTKYNMCLYFDCMEIEVLTGSNVTINAELNGSPREMKNLIVQSGATISINKAKGNFNVEGELSITDTQLTNLNGETNTFEGLAITGNGKVYVSNSPWASSVPHIYYVQTDGYLMGETGLAKWSIDAKNNIEFIKDSKSVKPADKNNDGDVIVIPAGKNLTVANFSTPAVVSVAVYGNLTILGTINISRKITDLIGENNKFVAYPGSNVVIKGTGAIKRYSSQQIIVYHLYSKSASLYKESTGKIKKLDNGEDYSMKVLHQIKGGRTYYMGASTEDGSSSVPTGTIQSYSPTSGEFSNGNFFATGKAGAVKLSSAGTISETGSVPFADKSYTLSLQSGKDYGWNLLCNPFTTSLPLQKESFSYTEGDVDPTIWFRVKVGSEYKFLTYSMATGVEAPSASQGGMAGPVAPQQAFYVKAKKAGASFTVKYPTSASAGATLKSSSITPDDILRLTISSEGGNTDEMAMVFREGGSLESTYGDAEKRGESATYNALFALKGNTQCVIPFYPEASVVEGVEMPLGFRMSSKSSKGTITATNLGEFGVASDVYLVDKQENTVINLVEEGSYEFTATAGKEVLDRFAIVLGNIVADDKNEDGVATGVQNISAKYSMTYSEEGLVVKLAGAESGVLRVYDSVGRMVETRTIAAQRTVVPLRMRGMFIAELTTDNGTQRTKILAK